MPILETPLSIGRLRVISQCIGVKTFTANRWIPAKAGIQDYGYAYLSKNIHIKQKGFLQYLLNVRNIMFQFSPTRNGRPAINNRQ